MKDIVKILKNEKIHNIKVFITTQGDKKHLVMLPNGAAILTEIAAVGAKRIHGFQNGHTVKDVRVSILNTLDTFMWVYYNEIKEVKGLETIYQSDILSSIVADKVVGDREIRDLEISISSSIIKARLDHIAATASIYDHESNELKKDVDISRVVECLKGNKGNTKITVRR